MNDTDKVIIALGFFTVVGFLAFCVLAMQGGGISLKEPSYVTVSQLKQAREEMRSGK